MRPSLSKRSSRQLALVLAALFLAGLGWLTLRAVPHGKVGLFTSLPIVWNEAGDLSDMLNPAEEQHWAKAAIERKGQLVPLDTLAADKLAGIDRLVIAQPRPLGPAENVALDHWLRNGGKLLLLADPLLTEESRFPLGDRRRPEGTVLLSPILTHWGLELQFDETRPPVEANANVMGVEVPVLLYGTFRLLGDGRNCRLWGNAAAVTCSIGKGRLVALGDAAVLERDDPEGRKASAFDWLLNSAFAAN